MVNKKVGIFIPTHNRRIDLGNAIRSVVIDNYDYISANQLQVVISSNSDREVELEKN